MLQHTAAHYAGATSIEICIKGQWIFLLSFCTENLIAIQIFYAKIIRIAHSGIVVANTQIIRRPRFQSFLHFHTRNMQQIHTGRQSANNRSLSSPATLEASRRPPAAKLERWPTFLAYRYYQSFGLLPQKLIWWIALLTGFQCEFTSFTTIPYPALIDYWLIIKVGFGISRTNADSQWNPVHKAFHRIHRCGNETIRH